DGDCPGGVCDTTTHACVECLEEADCVAEPTLPACDLTTNLCVPCLEDRHCASGWLCDVPEQLCVECLEDVHCGPGMRCEAKACVNECLLDDDCATMTGRPA